MTKSELFKAAHAQAKATVAIVGNYQISFKIALKEIYSNTTKSVADKLLAAGLKVWEKGNMKRIYMTCAQFNELTGRDYNLNNSNNKIFYDYANNAIMRSYKGKKPAIEIQY